MESRDQADALLQDYPDHSVWTTWTISYKTIQEKDKTAANLLLLWAFLDNKDLWHGLFAAACRESTFAARRLSEWIGDIASNELKFTRAIQLLRNYSLIEDVEDLASYATHPVVHRWAYHFQSEDSRVELAQLAVVVVGTAVPHSSTRDYSTMQRRLLPHAQVCSRWVSAGEIGRRTRRHDTDDEDFDETKEKVATLDAFHQLGLLYANQGKLVEAEKMYRRVLQEYEKALSPKHTLTLVTVNHLGVVYTDQGKLTEAEKMYEWALQGREEALGLKHISTLDTVNNLGTLYAYQGRLAEAEKMYEWALQGREEALGPKHTSTLDTVNNRGVLYMNQGKLTEAEELYKRALQGYEEALGLKHTTTLVTVNNLGILYTDQGKLAEAEKMYERALQGYEETLGPKHTPTLDTVNNLGNLYAVQGKLAEAEKMYERALQGYEDALGLKNVEKYRPALNTMYNRGNLYVEQGELTKAREEYSRALLGIHTILGPSSDEYQNMKAVIESIDLSQGKAQCVTNPLS